MVETKKTLGIEIMDLIFKGEYAEIWSAKKGKSGKLVAVKKFFIERYTAKDERMGMPPAVLRELYALAMCNHINIVRRQAFFTEEWTPSSSINSPVYFVMDYHPYDLRGLLASNHMFDLVEVKTLFKQLLSAVSYLHNELSMCHRDINPANVLVTAKHEVKLTDFGLARILFNRRAEVLPKSISQPSLNRTFTNNVVSTWYRPPELILGSTTYDFGVDIWPLGCILFEMVSDNCKVLFPGNNDFDVLTRIFKTMGFPRSGMNDGEFQSLNSFLENLDADLTSDVIFWPEYSLLDEKGLVKEAKAVLGKVDSRLRKVMEEEIKRDDFISEELWDLLSGLLMFDPSRRLKADDAYKHAFVHGDNQAERNAIEQPTTLPFLSVDGTSSSLHALEVS